MLKLDGFVDTPDTLRVAVGAGQEMLVGPMRDSFSPKNDSPRAPRSI